MRTKRAMAKFAIALAWILLGLMLNHFGLGGNDFSIFGSVGTYLIYIGFLGLLISGLTEVWRREKVVDERMEFVASKAMKLTFVCFILVAFIIMVIDGIKPITLPYHLFISYLVCGILAAYYISYKILLRFY